MGGMTTRCHTASEVIDAMGGTGKMAEWLGSTPQNVSNWRRQNRLPAKTFIALSDELARRGYSATADLWGMAEARAS